jgi:hypothetical protein
LKKQKKIVQQRKDTSLKKPGAKKTTGKKLQVPTSCEYITDSNDFNEDLPGEDDELDEQYVQRLVSSSNPCCLNLRG